MANKLNNIFNVELILRITSLLIFVPLTIIPIIFSNILLAIVYLLFNSIIIYELLLMKSENNRKIINVFILVITYTYFLFIIYIVTGSINPQIIIEIIFTIWIFDTFSYLGGKIFGGKKLIPKISSGKTISGLVIGILSTLILTQTYIMIFKEISINIILYTILVIIFSFIGDFFASLLKRVSDVKDSGSIMPGHGGLLDRFDSFIGVFFIFGIALVFL